MAFIQERVELFIIVSIYKYILKNLLHIFSFQSYIKIMKSLHLLNIEHNMCHVLNLVHRASDNVTIKIFHEDITQRFLQAFLLLLSFRILN